MPGCVAQSAASVLCEAHIPVLFPMRSDHNAILAFSKARLLNKSLKYGIFHVYLKQFHLRCKIRNAI